MNPFGNASAVDTASKLAELEIKENGSTRKEVEPLKAQESIKDSDVTESMQDTHIVVEAPMETEKPSEAMDKKESKRREPEIVNSRAVAFENAPNVKRDVSLLFTSLYLHCIHVLTVTFMDYTLTPIVRQSQEQ